MISEWEKTKAERQALRIILLKEIYDVYFKNGKDSLFTPKKLTNDVELAYQYLMDKQLIKPISSGRIQQYKITALGIDHIESSDNIK